MAEPLATGATAKTTATRPSSHAVYQGASALDGQDEIRILSTAGILGYGFPLESLEAGMRRKPHMISADGGSSDPGPYYLGSGEAFVSRLAMRRDLRLMLHAALDAGIPLMVGTAGGAGGAPHLDMLASIVREIAAEDGLHFKMATIGAEQDKTYLARQIESGRVRALGRLPDLDAALLDRVSRVVAMMGPEPYMRALGEGAQVILGGRSTDPAPFAALALRAGLPEAVAWYAGKMLECGAAPATPKGPDCLLATLRADSVTCEPTGTQRRCTVMSVASHALHETASPVRHTEPGGILDTEACHFEQVSDKAVRVTGMRWIPDQTYKVKLEGVEFVGFRVGTVCATRDPRLISQIEPYLELVKARVQAKASDMGVASNDYVLTIRCYGRNGVMAEREPVLQPNAHELCFLVDVVAAHAEQAAAVLALARTNMLHNHFEGRQCTEGNMAIPYSPSDFKMGEVYRFVLAHTMVLDDPCAVFPMQIEEV